MEIIGTILIFGYFIALIVIGILSSRKETAEGFLLGDRNVGTISTFTTVAASQTGAGFILTIVALTYLYGGIGGLGYVTGLVAGFSGFYFFARSRLKNEADQNKYYTLADYIFKSYGQVAGYLAASLTFLILCCTITMQLIGGSKTVFEITGINYGYGLLIISVVILFYLMMGGFKAVIKTDFLQYIAIVITIIVLLFALVNLGEMNPRYLDIKEAGWLNTIVFILFGLISPFFASEFFRRIYATRNQQTLKKSLILSITIYPAIALVVVLIGLMIRTHLPNIDPETAFIRGLIDLLPTAFLGVGAVLMFSAIMSSADTYIFTNTSIILQDFLLRNKKISKQKLVSYFRITMLVLVAIGVMVAYLLKSLIISTYLWGSLGSILATIIIATWLFKKLPPLAVSLGFILGLAILFSAMIGTSFALEPIIVGYSLGGTVLGLIIGSLISKTKTS